MSTYQTARSTSKIMFRTRPRARIAPVSQRRWRDRQLTSADRAAIVDLFTGLSPSSGHSYFLGALKPSARHFEWIDALDGSTRIAVGAFEKHTGVLVGIAQCAADADDQSRAEVGIVVADGWQQQGIGTRLLAELTRLAGSAGMTTLWGVMFADNFAAQSLAEKLGSAAVSAAGPGVVEYEVDRS